MASQQEVDARAAKLEAERARVGSSYREELERCALQNGMTTLWADGINKVAEGLTTIDELERVLGID